MYLPSGVMTLKTCSYFILIAAGLNAGLVGSNLMEFWLQVWSPVLYV